MTETYIPNAKDAVIAYFGRNTAKNLRCYCVRCNDTSPLTGAEKIYGDLTPSEPADACDACGALLLDLSRACQREHDEQQAKWTKQPITALVEYGISSAPRCRIY